MASPPGTDERGTFVTVAPNTGDGVDSPAGTRLRQLNGDGTVTQWWKVSEKRGLAAPTDLNSPVRWIKTILVPDARPDRMLFVAKGWTLGADPNVFFTSIQDAIDYAVANLTPTAANSVGIRVFPGTYAENITQAAAFVDVICVDPTRAPTFHRPVILDGTMSYTPVGAGAEPTRVVGLRITGAVNYDETGKAGGTSSIRFEGCSLASTLTGASRAAPTTGGLSLGDTVVEGTMTTDSDVTFDPGTRVLGLVSTASAARNMVSRGAEIGTGGLTLVAGANSITFVGRQTTIKGIIDNDANATVDVLGGVHEGTYGGAGPVDRTNDVLNGVTTTGGGVTDTISFAKPYIAVGSLVIVPVQTVAAAGGTMPKIDNVTTTSFDVTDFDVGGRTFAFLCTQRGP